MPIQKALPRLRRGLAGSMQVPLVADALITSAIEQAQLALAARRLKMNADAALEVAQQNLNRIANLSPGIGGKLDVSR
jgi:hypothetical protein